MIRFFVIAVTCLAFCTHGQHASAQMQFASQSTSFESAPLTATILHFNATANIDRVMLYWTLDKNQAIDQIQVEKSKDEKKFSVTGLVFGTDQPEKTDYLFYEKNPGVKYYYRLKVIRKDGGITYSTAVIPEKDKSDKR